MVELVECDDLFDNPLHPYTPDLVQAVPILDADSENARARRTIKCEAPSPVDPPLNCVFHLRRPLSHDAFVLEFPDFREDKPGHWVACTKV